MKHQPCLSLRRTTNFLANHNVAVKCFRNAPFLSLNRRICGLGQIKDLFNPVTSFQQCPKADGWGRAEDHGKKPDTTLIVPQLPIIHSLGTSGAVHGFFALSHILWISPPTMCPVFPLSLVDLQPLVLLLAQDTLWRLILPSLSARETAVTVYCLCRFSSCTYLTITVFISNSVLHFIVMSSSIYIFALYFFGAWFHIYELMNSRNYINKILIQNYYLKGAGCTTWKCFFPWHKSSLGPFLYPENQHSHHFCIVPQEEHSKSQKIRGIWVHTDFGGYFWYSENNPLSAFTSLRFSPKPTLFP